MHLVSFIKSDLQEIKKRLTPQPLNKDIAVQVIQAIPEPQCGCFDQTPHMAKVNQVELIYKF